MLYHLTFTLIFLIPAGLYIYAAIRRIELILFPMGLFLAMVSFLTLDTDNGASNTLASPAMIYAPLAVLCIFRTFSKSTPIRRHDFGLVLPSLAWTIWSVIIGAAIAIAYGMVKLAIGADASEAIKTNPIGSGEKVVIFVGVSLWEETFFRGIFYGELKHKINSKLLLAITISLYFALAHWNKILVLYRATPWEGISYAMLLLVAGMTTSYLREKDGILPAVLCHGTFNVLNGWFY
jgi:membrane protease YdiL (CAAX protease family)